MEIRYRKMEKIIGIYKITSPSDRVYIGQSCNIKYRFNQYKKEQCKKQTKLYNSFKKYGVWKHHFEVITECDIEDLNVLERYYQEEYDVLNKGLNCLYVNTKTLKGVVSDYTKNKLSIASRGKKISEKHKKILSELKKGSKNHMFNINTEDHHSSKLVLNLSSGVYYDSAKDAAESLNIKYKNLSRYLNGSRFNKTNFIYV